MIKRKTFCIEPVQEDRIRRKGVSLRSRPMPLSLSLNSLTNLRESNLLAESKVVREKKKFSSIKSKDEEKKGELGASLVESQSVNTAQSIVNSMQTQNTLITNASSGGKGIMTKSLEVGILTSPKSEEKKTPNKDLMLSNIIKDDADPKTPEATSPEQKAAEPKPAKKRVHFAEEDILSESSKAETFESEDSGEVWFNDTARTTLLNDFFANEENIIEFVITIFALIKNFNKSYYIMIMDELPDFERESLEEEISKISDELSKQITQNQMDNNMAESNYLIVIQRELEDTQIRLGETERLLRQQQKEYTDLEIEANNLIRSYEECRGELEVMRRINEMLQEEVEQGGVKIEEVR